MKSKLERDSGTQTPSGCSAEGRSLSPSFPCSSPSSSPSSSSCAKGTRSPSYCSVGGFSLSPSFLSFPLSSSSFSSCAIGTRTPSCCSAGRPSLSPSIGTRTPSCCSAGRPSLSPSFPSSPSLSSLFSSRFSSTASENTYTPPTSVSNHVKSNISPSLSVYGASSSLVNDPQYTQASFHVHGIGASPQPSSFASPHCHPQLTMGLSKCPLPTVEDSCHQPIGLKFLPHSSYPQLRLHPQKQPPEPANLSQCSFPCYMSSTSPDLLSGVSCDAASVPTQNGFRTEKVVAPASTFQFLPRSTSFHPLSQTSFQNAQPQQQTFFPFPSVTSSLSTAASLTSPDCSDLPLDTAPGGAYTHHPSMNIHPQYSKLVLQHLALTSSSPTVAPSACSSPISSRASLLPSTSYPSSPSSSTGSVPSSSYGSLFFPYFSGGRIYPDVKDSLSLQILKQKTLSNPGSCSTLTASSSPTTSSTPSYVITHELSSRLYQHSSPAGVGQPPLDPSAHLNGSMTGNTAIFSPPILSAPSSMKSSEITRSVSCNESTNFEVPPQQHLMPNAASMNNASLYNIITFPDVAQPTPKTTAVDLTADTYTAESPSVHSYLTTGMSQNEMLPGHDFDQNCTRSRKNAVRECSICHKIFTRPHSFKIHMYSHSGRSVFPCSWSECTKVFTQKSHLKVHERIHTGKMLSTCTWKNCGKKFTRKLDLDKHLRVHTGQKPYVCVVCGWAFSQSNNAYSHVINRHKNDVIDAANPSWYKSFVTRHVVHS